MDLVDRRNSLAQGSSVAYIAEFPFRGRGAREDRGAGGLFRQIKPRLLGNAGALCAP
jgi:hypothetical protein